MLDFNFCKSKFEFFNSAEGLITQGNKKKNANFTSGQLPWKYSFVLPVLLIERPYVAAPIN